MRIEAPATAVLGRPFGARARCTNTGGAALPDVELLITPPPASTPTPATTGGGAADPVASAAPPLLCLTERARVGSLSPGEGAWVELQLVAIGGVGLQCAQIPMRARVGGEAHPPRGDAASGGGKKAAAAPGASHRSFAVAAWQCRVELEVRVEETWP